MKQPDITYRFARPIDTASPTFEVYSRTDSDTQAAIGVSVGFFGLPKDRVLVLSNATLLADPGATQNVSDMRMEFLTATGLNVPFARGQAGAGDQRRIENWQGEIYIFGQGPDLFNLLFNATFNAAVNPNLLNASASGVVIPRANMASF